MDSSALERHYRQYGYAVFNRCRRVLGDAAAADDAVQEVFLRAQRYSDGLRPETALAWLLRVADRHCFDVLQQRRRIALAQEGHRALEARPVDGEGERTRLVVQVLAACKPRIRDTAVLYYMDELTQDEVAAAMQCSRKTVKERLLHFKDTAAKLLGIRGDPSTQAKR